MGATATQPQGGGVVRVDHGDETRILGDRDDARPVRARQALLQIYEALREKGYDPVRQMAHFLLTGEPTYITAHRGARGLAQKLERDEVVEELLRFYLVEHESPRGR